MAIADYTRVLDKSVVRYCLAVFSVAVALLIRAALNPLLGNSVPYVFLFPAVAFSAWYCGLGASIVSIVVALVSTRYWLLPPVHSFHVPDTSHLIGMAAFLLASGVVVIMGEARRRENERIQALKGKLELQVKERTAKLDAANQNLRELTARLLQLRDEERRRFARELHDSVGQILAALGMSVSTALADIERLSKTADALRQSESLIQEVSKEVRTISHLLHPPLLDEAGLSSALSWFVDGFSERSKIKVDLEFPKDFGRLPLELETAIFRVVQECLTNIHRHSGSPSAKIRIAQSNGGVFVEIEDKGRGVPPEKLIDMNSDCMAGVGIRGMRERLRQLGGSFEISSGVNGTKIQACLPFSATASSSTAA